MKNQDWYLCLFWFGRYGDVMTEVVIIYTVGHKINELQIHVCLGGHQMATLVLGFGATNRHEHPD